MRTEIELLDAWRGGDRAAGDQLLRTHFDSVCRFFRTKLGDDVDDVIQGTFLDCIESRDRVGTSFRAYLFGVARNRLTDVLRGKHHRAQQLDLSEISIEDLKTSPSQKVARGEEERLLIGAMRQIPVDFQIALELAYWEEMSGHEIAAVLGIAENTVRSRLARARDALRERLGAHAPALGPTLRRLDDRIDQT